MNSMIKKISIICLCFVLLIGLVMTNCEGNWTPNINGYATATKESGAANSVYNIAQAAITVARVIALGVAVIMLFVLGMKYMSAAPSERATFKKSAITYVVGALIMFATAGILTIIKNFAVTLNE